MTVESRRPKPSRASGPSGRARSARPPRGYGYTSSYRPRPRSHRARRGRGGVVILVALLGVALVAGLVTLRSGALTSWLEVSQTSSPVRIAIVDAAKSQVGYTTDPQDTYCNKFSAYWGAGYSQDQNGEACAAGTASQEWCADFAAWAWQKGGISFTYGYGSGQLNGGSISFYNWAVANGTWHPAGSGYLPQPGDVAIYGINSSATWAAHVAVVTGYQRFTHAPYAINGDGDLGGFSVVVAIPDETRAAISGDEELSGYASPVR